MRAAGDLNAPADYAITGKTSGRPRVRAAGDLNAAEDTDPYLWLGGRPRVRAAGDLNKLLQPGRTPVVVAVLV